jgi:hypothetical protein
MKKAYHRQKHASSTSDRQSDVPQKVPEKAKAFYPVSVKWPCLFQAELNQKRARGLCHKRVKIPGAAVQLHVCAVL